VDGIRFKEPTIGPGGLPIEIRLQRNNLDELKLASTELINGDRVPLDTVATITSNRGYAGIKRVDAERTVTITGYVDTRLADAADIIADTKTRFLPKLKKQFPGIIIGLEGQAKEMKASMGGMIKAFGMDVFGVLCLLSFQFRSYQEPLVIMVTIPLACSIMFGLLMSTILVLLVVPSLYAILGDFNLVRIDTKKSS